MAQDYIVKVKGIKAKLGGNLILFVFGAEGFPKEHDKALALFTVPVTTQEVAIAFQSEEPEVALKILHDENGDGKVTKNWTKIIPKDGLGFSKGQKITFQGVPKYKKSKVTAQEMQSGLEVNLHYYSGEK